MEIFTKLGIDFTLFIQMALFLIVYAILYPLILKPLFNAYKQREELVLGDPEDKAKKLAEIEKLKNKYESKLRTLHLRIQDIFTKVKGETTKQCDQKIFNAKRDATNMTDQTRQKIALEQRSANQQLEKEIPQLTRIAVDKILGK